MASRNWAEWISYKRYGYQSRQSETRSEFTRDYDKIIFMSAFRRLQNKTQVFPLPGNVFVHNRLTHSLEVASVGRSIGASVGQAIVEQYGSTLDDKAQDFYKHELSGVVASACLAHDLGNPAFGHSGEKAMSNFFIRYAETIINGQTLRSHYSDQEWSDIIAFEGNANALRLLTRQYKGKLDGGQALTYMTLASILKYPCASTEIDKSLAHRKKYGYFQSDQTAFDAIVDELQMHDDEGKPIRHPFVYLVEAADDICYRIIDVEDAHRIKILSTVEVKQMFLALIDDLDYRPQRTREVLDKIADDNEAISFLRSWCISALIDRCKKVFIEYSMEINQGSFNSTLLDEIEKVCPSLKHIKKVSIDRIYNHSSVIEVEIAGYNVMSELLHVFLQAVLEQYKSPLQQKSIQLIPSQYDVIDNHVSAYEKTMGVLDFVSGMTDGYATELYRKIKGIDIPSHR
jgi:dGTPase